MGKPLYARQPVKEEQPNALDFDEPKPEEPASPDAPAAAPTPAPEPPQPPTARQPDRDNGTTTSREIVNAGKEVGSHPLSTPIPKTEVGTSWPPEHGFVTVCKGCQREEIHRTNNASRVPGRCDKCGAPLQLVGEVA